MQDNICRKYGITHEELQEGVDRYSKIATPKFAGDIHVLMAIIELLVDGDIPYCAEPLFEK